MTSVCGYPTPAESVHGILSMKWSVKFFGPASTNGGRNGRLFFGVPENGRRFFVRFFLSSNGRRFFSALSLCRKWSLCFAVLKKWSLFFAVSKIDRCVSVCIRGLRVSVRVCLLVSLCFCLCPSRKRYTGQSARRGKGKTLWRPCQVAKKRHASPTQPGRPFLSTSAGMHNNHL